MCYIIDIYTDNPIINLSVVRCQRCSVAKSMAETTTNNVSMSDVLASKLQLTPTPNNPAANDVSQEEPVQNPFFPVREIDD